MRATERPEAGAKVGLAVDGGELRSANSEARKLQVSVNRAAIAVTGKAKTGKKSY